MSSECDIADEITKKHGCPFAATEGTRLESLQLSSESESALKRTHRTRHLAYSFFYQDVCLPATSAGNKVMGDSKLQVIGSQCLLIIALDFMKENI